MVMHTELQATCSALGYLEGGKYEKEPDCLETVKDLIRFLKREDESCDIRRQLGHAQILQNDLIPILKTYKEDRDLVDTIMRLLVNITQPAVLCFNNHIPEDKTTRNQFLEVEQYLQTYKQAFADESLFAVLTKKLGDLLQLDWENRQEEDRLLIERILILVRNILHIPPDPARERRTDDDASVHDQVLWALHVSGMEDLLLYISSSDDERQFCMHALEIISLMFREQTPEQLASAGQTRAKSEKERDEEEIEMIREKERLQKLANEKKYSTRHSRFGGTYVIQNMKSISNNSLIYHRSLGNAGNFSFDQNKVPKKKPKNRKPIKENELTRRSTLSIRIFLKEFCVQFLENCYNPLMYAVKDSLLHSKTQENDETYYLWAMRFFMEFSRHYNFRVDVIGETMSVPCFHYIQTNMLNYHEMVFSDKKDAIVWSKRMHLALKAYKELLLTLLAMDNSHDEQLKKSSKVLKGNIFYMDEYRDIFLMMLKKFDQSRQSRSFLRDLVETVHIFLKMLETFCKKNKHVIVQKKKKKPKKKKKASTPEEPATGNLFTEQELGSMWDDISGDLSAIFQGREDVPEDVSPFDAASDVDMEQQRVEAMIKIHEALRNKNAGEAVALFRAAREVWPEQEEFGAADISPEDEFMALREIFFANIPNPAANVSQEDGDLEGQGEEEEEVEEEERNAAVNYEQEFSLREFVVKFSNHQVLKPYVLLFGEYHKNSSHTNHCIVKMLHRVAMDCGIPAVLFQISLFRVFQRILQDPMARSEKYKEMVKFSTFVVRQFFEVAADNNKAFMELMFWKNVKEAVELKDGYGTYKSKSAKSAQIWPEELDNQLKYLYEKFRDVEEGGLDVVDHIMDHLSDKEKTRRMIIRELAHLGLISGAKDIKKNKGSRASNRVWLEEQETELHELYQQFKNSGDPVGNIMANMGVKRSKAKIIEKLLDLGLVSDRKELYKKRKRKNRGGSGSESEDNDRLFEHEEAPEPQLPSDSESEAKMTSSSSSSSSSSSESDSDGDDGDDANNQSEGGAVGDLVTSLHQSGLADALKWIQTALRRTAEDREEDDDKEPIPLVPLTEENDDAMENKTFKEMLKRIGVCPPANEQERFWRIPGHFTPVDLRLRADALEENSTITLPDAPKSAKKKKSRFSVLKAMAKTKRKDIKAKEKAERTKRRSANKESLSQATTATNQTKKKKGSRLKKTVDSDSSDEEHPSKTRSVRSVASSNRSVASSNQSATNSNQSKQSSDSDSDNGRSSQISRNSNASQSGHGSGSASNKSSSRSSSDNDDDDVPLSAKGNAKDDVSSKANTSESSNDSSSDDEPLTAQTSQKRSKPDSSSSDDKPLSTKNSQKSQPKKKATQVAQDINIDSSDSEDMPLSKTSQNQTQPVTKTSQNRKEPVASRLKRTLESSSEDSDDDRLLIHEKTSQPSKRTKIQVDSDSEKENAGDKTSMKNDMASFPATMFSQPMGSDSDSDIEDHIPLRRAVK